MLTIPTATVTANTTQVLPTISPITSAPVTTKTVPIAVANTISSFSSRTGNDTTTENRVYLDGSNSYIPTGGSSTPGYSGFYDVFYDHVGDPLLTYNWTLTSKPSGSNAVLSSSTAEKPIFTADRAGSYLLSLIVNNGVVSSAATTLTITVNDAPVSAPSTPTGLKVTQVTSNSVSLSWDTSIGGYGNVAGYRIYRNGIEIPSYLSQAISGTSAIATIITDTYAKPSRSYTYTVASYSLVETYSAQSAPVTTTTLPLSLMLNKFVPVILFDTKTSKILKQGYASPGMMSKATVITGDDIIVHPKVDATQYKITSIGNRVYEITSFATNLPIETNIVATTLSNTASNGDSYAIIDMVTGADAGSGSGGGLNFYNIMEGYGTYISGEIL